MSTNETQMESKCEPPQPEAIVEGGVKSNPDSPIKIEKSDEHEKMNKSNGLEVAIMLPPPPVLVPLVAAATTKTDIATVEANPRPPSSTTATTDKVDEEEVLSLQVLSARSSTPYTVQGVCCANANCGLEATTDSSNASQWKEQDEPTQLVSEVMKEDVIDPDEDDGKHKHLNGLHSDEGKKYSRSDLLDIREEMTIIKPEFLEGAKLQHLHFRKLGNVSSNGIGISRNKSYRKPNPPNDLMPAFFKRKTAAANGTGNSSNSIVYDNFKYNDSSPFNHHNDSNSSANSNYRRIGSGRISNREVNWDYIPEEDPNKNNLPEFFNTKDSIGSIQPKPQRAQKKHDIDDNSNYVKRVIGSVTGGESSFRSIGSRHSINSSGEERYSSNASSSTNNRSEEPEWFSCGPTSRLDTIELCGFNESDQQKIRIEMSKNKADSNNNRPDFSAAGHNHKEKKHLAFQFDDFSTSHNSKPSHNGQGGNSNAGSKMPSSKFMPLFNAKKRDEEPNATHHSSTQSLNEFFKRSDMPLNTAAPPAGSHKEKLSTTEMPSVDEIEAKWRSHQTNDSRGKPSSENINNSSESFKKILHQLNQQQQGSRAGSISSPPPPQHQQQSNTSNTSNNQHTPLNLFNNDNLSNFIKHRNLQQQLLQKQQQQAAFAQLQFNAILSRPDTQMLLLSLARGEISKHGLVIQLANPNLTQADREAISAVLTFSAAGQYHQQLAINSNQQQQQQFIANQLQNLALMHQMNKSPVSRRNANAGGGTSAGAGGYQANNTTGVGNNQRTYTQEELQSHANFILHNAMLKKKLEEQNIGLQKILHLQTSMINGNINNNNLRGSGGGNDSMTGTKNLHYQQQHQPQLQLSQQQQQQNNQLHQQKSQRHRKFSSNTGNRNNHSMGRRRSTSSSSSNTASSGNLASQLQQTVNMQLRRQLEQRRNTIATATVGGGDEYNQISQRI